MKMLNKLTWTRRRPATRQWRHVFTVCFLICEALAIIGWGAHEPVEAIYAASSGICRVIFHVKRKLAINKTGWYGDTFRVYIGRPQPFNEISVALPLTMDERPKHYV